MSNEKGNRERNEQDPKDQMDPVEEVDGGASGAEGAEGAGRPEAEGSSDLTIPDSPDVSPPADATPSEPDLDLRLRGDDPEPADHGFDEPPSDEPPAEEPPPDEPFDEPAYVEPLYDDAPAYEYEPPRAPLHHRLMRRPEGKVVAGVCSGLGAYTNTDPVLWRVGFVIFGLTSIGVLVYIVLWLVMPEARRGEPLPERPPHEAAQITRWAALAAIILGCWVLFKGIFNFGGGWFWGLLLIGIGIAVWGRDLVGPRNRTPDGPPFPPAPPPAPEPWNARHTSRRPQDRANPANPPARPASPATPTASSGSAWSGPRHGGTAPTTPLPPTRPPRYAPPRAVRRRESSYLGRLVVGACALAIGLGLVLNNTGVIDLTAKGLLSVLVGLIGAGLIVGSWAGRARWLIFPGIALSFALLISSWAPAFVGGSFGEIVWQPQNRKELLASYEHGAGQAVLDLTEVAFDEKPREIEVDVNFGELLVVIPEEVPVTSNTHVQGGEINNLGTMNDGWDIESSRSDGGDKDIGLLTLDAEVVFGELTVRRELPDDEFTAGTQNGRRRDFRFDLGPIGTRGDR
jgi:phage shock protein PspC (stress-responsive transcriptional regulator)